mgnify:CR=1 FL=1
MIKNYLTIAFRQLYKNKIYSILNIGGLALGLAAFLLILEFVSLGPYLQFLLIFQF